VSKPKNTPFGCPLIKYEVETNCKWLSVLLRSLPPPYIQHPTDTIYHPKCTFLVHKGVQERIRSLDSRNGTREPNFRQPPITGEYTNPQTGEGNGPQGEPLYCRNATPTPTNPLTGEGSGPQGEPLHERRVSQRSLEKETRVVCSANHRTGQLGETGPPRPYD
jgi:hypothetical protein